MCVEKYIRRKIVYIVVKEVYEKPFHCAAIAQLVRANGC